jgi:hypothetical protein
MSQEVFNQAEEFFKGKEEWYSFLNLCDYRDRISWNWFQKCKQELNHRFQETEIDENNNWLFVSWGNFEFKWYLKDFGTESLCIYLQNSIFQLYANGNLYDIEEMTNLLQRKEYTPIVSGFERQDEICPGNSWAKVLERGNFRFGDDYDGNFDNLRLAWYANFKTNELADQIVRKVNRFRKNDEIIRLILEINKKTKKE